MKPSADRKEDARANRIFELIFVGFWLVVYIAVAYPSFFSVPQLHRQYPNIPVAAFPLYGLLHLILGLALLLTWLRKEWAAWVGFAIGLSFFASYLALGYPPGGMLAAMPIVLVHYWRIFNAKRTASART